MKSERRHELATNELADWIANFPKWLNENLTAIIIGAVVVVGLIAYTFFYYSREDRLWNTKDAQIAALLDQLQWQKRTVLEGKEKGIVASDIFINMASGYQSAADDTQNQPLSALAMIKRAEALRTELHYRPKPAEQDVRKYQIQQAMKIYAQALEKSKEAPTTAAMAEYGIALCLEDMGDFTGAKAAYGKISQADEYKGTLYQARAQLRLGTLSDNQGMVIFAKSATPEPNAPQKPLSLDEPLTGIEGAIGKELDFNSVK